MLKNYIKITKIVKMVASMMKKRNIASGDRIRFPAPLREMMMMIIDDWRDLLHLGLEELLFLEFSDFPCFLFWLPPPLSWGVRVLSH